MKKITFVKRYLSISYKKLSKKSKNSFEFLLSIQNDCLDLHPLTIENNSDMKNEIIYRNKTIIEGTNGIFTAYYSNYSANLTKDFKTLKAAKNQIDKWLN